MWVGVCSCLHRHNGKYMMTLKEIKETLCGLNMEFNQVLGTGPFATLRQVYVSVSEKGVERP